MLLIWLGSMFYIYKIMEQVAGIEPASQPWQGCIITIIRYLQGLVIL